MYGSDSSKFSEIIAETYKIPHLLNIRLLEIFNL